MTDFSTLEAIRGALTNANTFVDLFGPQSPGDTGEKEIKKAFARLARLIHPDHVPSPLKGVAGDLFMEMKTRRDSAIDALRNGTYGKPFQKSAPEVSNTLTVTGIKETYELDSASLIEGDFSFIYRGTARVTGDRVIVKIAQEPTANVSLETEAEILRRFGDKSSKNQLKDLASFVPSFVESFVVTEAGGYQRRVTVLTEKSGYISLADIIKAYPDGLDPRDAVWICRRVLGQVLAALKAGVVHTAIVPDHILVHPISHDPLHIGWTHALQHPTKSGRLVTQYIDRYQAWYPDEVRRHETPDHRTDLYMAGKTMIALLGGDVRTNKLPSAIPIKLAEHIRRSVTQERARRPDEVWKYFDEFGHIVKSLWGRVYRPLLMPTQQ